MYEEAHTQRHCRRTHSRRKAHRKQSSRGVRAAMSDRWAVEEVAARAHRTSGESECSSADLDPPSAAEPALAAPLANVGTKEAFALS